MATGRIRRSAQRGVAAAVLGWLGVAAFSVLMAPSAAAAPTVTIDIQNFTPPVASVDKGGQVTFVNRIPDQNKGGISVPLVGSVSATVHTDVSVTFFGQRRDLQPGQSATWSFPEAATTGFITYTYRVVPQAGLTVNLVDQVVNNVLGQLPPAPVNVPYVVQTIAPGLPNLPSVGVPQLPQLTVPLPSGQILPPGTPGGPGVPQTPGTVGGAPTGATGGSPLASTPGDVYRYDTGAGVPQMTPSDVVAASAFDPSRYFIPGRSLGGADRAGPGGGAGGVAGSYDGASVPVFGQLAGLDDVALDGSDPVTEAASDSAPVATLPAAALAAVVALAAVTAALVRTHQASRSPR